MKKLYSVKFLLESIVVPNPSPESKTFEEVIILLESDSKEYIEEKMIEHYPDHSYENALGGLCTWRFVKVLDVFEMVDRFEEDVNFKEVYSRYFPFEKMITAEEVIELYSLDV